MCPNERNPIPQTKHLIPRDVQYHPLYNVSMLADPGTPNTSTPAKYSPSPYSNRERVFESLCNDIPTNSYDLPEHFYRADLIPANLQAIHPSQRFPILQAARLEITYREGFPTFLDGTPIWGRMEYEDAETHTLFELYLAQINDKGYRQLSELTLDNGTTVKNLHEFFTYYFWAARAKAYDLFKAAVARKLRERRMAQIEDRHFLSSEKYLNILEENESIIFSDEKLNELSPLDAIKMFEKLSNIQRTALGLNGKPSNGEANGASPPNASLEVTLRSIARGASQGEDAGPGQDASRQDRSRALQLLLDSPDTAALAQELIIKMNQKPNDPSGSGLTVLPKDFPMTGGHRSPTSGGHVASAPSDNTIDITPTTVTTPDEEEEGDLPIDTLDEEMIGIGS